MSEMEHLDDLALLADQRCAAGSFSIFYRRHGETVLRFFARRGVAAEEAADLTAETFAAALIGRARCRDGVPLNWLLGIASHKLADSQKRFARERRATERLGLEIRALSQEDRDEYLALLASEAEDPQIALNALSELPPAQRAAIEARVLNKHRYSRISEDLGVADATARQHVSRGLATLRARLKGTR